MKYLKTVSLYTFVGFLNAGVGFLILPVLTHYLLPADYGIISLMNAYVTILIPLVGLSTASLISVEYYNKKIPPSEFKVLFSSVRVIPLLTFIPLFLIFVLGQGYLPSLMELPKHAYWLILPLTLFALYQDNFRSFLVVSKRSYLFSITVLGKVGLEIPLSVLLIIYAGMKWDGRIYAWLAAVSLFSLISVLFYKKWNLLSSRIDKKYILQAITFGSPLILHQIGKFVIDQSDRIFLAKMISVDEMGIYSVGSQIAMVILVFVTAFSNFFSPFVFERLHKGGDHLKKEIVRLSLLFLTGLFIVLIFLVAFSPLLFEYFINNRYSDAVKYVFWIGLGYFFWAIYIVFSNYLFFLKKSRILGYVAILNIALNLALNYFFIRLFGGIGAAYATCISFLIVAIVIATIANKLYPMPWRSVFRKRS